MPLLRSAACFLLASATLLADEPEKQTIIKISKKTTHITEPLDKQGYVDYIEAVNQLASKGVTPENNYEVVFRRVMGPGEISEAIRPEYYRRLGIPLPKGKRTWFVSYPEYCGAKKANEDAQQAIYDEFDRLMEKPWKAADFPRAAKWLESVEKQLDALVEGSKRPRCYTPYSSGTDGEQGQLMIAVLLPSAQQQRDIARSLKMRAMYRIGRHDADGAWSDIQAMHRVARHSASAVTLIEWLVGIAIDSIAFRAERQVLASFTLTKRQARRFFADHARLKPLPAGADKIDVGERFNGLDAVQWVARRSDGNFVEALNFIKELSSIGGPSNGLFFVSADDEEGNNAKEANNSPDWNLAMEIMNGWYDRLVRAMRESDVVKRRKMFEQIDADIKELKGELGGTKLLFAKVLGGKSAGRMIGNLMVALLVPAVHQSRFAEDRATVRQRVMRLALAAEVYRREKGRYPKQLDDLAPAYVKNILDDPHTGEPLHVIAAEKSFVIYSVGRNLEDDGGRGYDDREAGEEVDDIAVRLGRP